MFVFHLTNDLQIQRPLLPKAAEAEAEAEAASTAAIQLIDTEGGYMIRKWPASTPKPHFLVTAGAYLFATKFQISLIYAFIGCP